MNKRKIDLAMERIAKAQKKHGSAIFMGHSGGKDSTVLHHLAKHVLPEVHLVHNVKPMSGTSNDPVAKLTEMHPETLRFMYETVAKENYVHFMPASKMKKFISSNCFECQLDGARASEYNRAGKSSQIIVGGKSISRKDMTSYVDFGMFDIAVSYPIFDWTDDDVFDYISYNELKISKEYFEGGEQSEWSQYWERKLRHGSW